MKKELNRVFFGQSGAVRHILPPHILRSIAEKGSSRQRTWALQTMAMDNTFRAIRAGAQAKAPLPRARVRSLALEGQAADHIRRSPYPDAAGHRRSYRRQPAGK